MAKYAIVQNSILIDFVETEGKGGARQAAEFAFNWKDSALDRNQSIDVIAVRSVRQFRAEQRTIVSEVGE